LPVSFNSQTTSVCTVSGSLVTLVAVGTCTIQATQAGNATYAAATPVNQSFQVTPAGGGSGTSGLVVPHVVDGGGWQTTFGITNTTATTATATLQFYQQTDTAGDTQAWTPPLAGDASTTNIQLAPGATVFLQTLGTAPTLTQGFGELIASAGVQGYAIFTWHVGSGYQDGTALAAAPGEDILVPFDNSSGIVTGLAVVNAGNSAETLSANLLLASGQVVPGSLPSIPSLGHTSFTLPSQFSQSAGQQGTLELSSAGTFSVVGLRFHTSGAFTSLPVYAVSAAPFPAAARLVAAPGANQTASSAAVTPAASSGASGLIIPHVVDGGGWQTTFGITNTTATTATAMLQFYQQTDTAGDTQAWTPPLAGGVSTTNMQLAPGATIFLHTQGTASALTQGFGELIAGAGVQGYAIFTWHVGSGYQDGTALAAAPGENILVPFDNSSGIVTGIAVVNTSGAAETISANLLLASGQVVPGSLPSIPSLGHTSFTLPSLFPQSAGQRGTLELSSSTGTFSVVGLRFHASGAFTSLPVYTVSAAAF
jgi:hypothetical protein